MLLSDSVTSRAINIDLFTILVQPQSHCRYVFVIDKNVGRIIIYGCGRRRRRHEEISHELKKNNRFWPIQVIVCQHFVIEKN